LLLKLNDPRPANLKWTVSWCLTMPPSAAYIAPAGTAAIAVKQKMVLMVGLLCVYLYCFRAS